MSRPSLIPAPACTSTTHTTNLAGSCLVEPACLHRSSHPSLPWLATCQLPGTRRACPGCTTLLVVCSRLAVCATHTRLALAAPMELAVSNTLSENRGKCGKTEGKK